MTLNPHPIHPAAGAYLLRLHRDARPAEGLLMGRIQHVANGDWSDFSSSSELLDWLARHFTQLQAQAAEPEDPTP
jgi:hypothetical protein